MIVEWQTGWMIAVALPALAALGWKAAAAVPRFNPDSLSG
jgi:hypothetical protein